VISDHALGDELLRQLVNAGVSFAFLHGEDRYVARTLTSDIDLVVDRPGAAVAQMLYERVCPQYCLVLAWEYDTGALTTFWMSSNGNGIVQLDLLFDPAGRGKYGLRTSYALGRVKRGVEWPVLDAVDTAVYLAVKRAVKHQSSEALHQSQSGHPPDSDMFRSLISRPASRKLLQLYAGKRVGPDLREWAQTFWRLAGRMVKPAGRVVTYLPSEEHFASALVEKWQGFMPRVSMTTARVGLRLRLAVRFKVGLVFAPASGSPRQPTGTAVEYRQRTIAMLTVACLRDLRRGVR
jgi:hypothetical protein